MVGEHLSGIVLHIDDDEAARELIALVLSGHDHRVMSAVNGAQALDLVVNGLRPDLLIVDFNLGDDSNGAEVTEQLRRALGYTPPVILLTADPSNAQCPWITDAPIWLAHKPFPPKLLLAVTRPLVELSRAMRRVARAERGLTAEAIVPV